MHFFIDGSFKDEKNAFIPVLDLGFIRGYSVFEYLRTYKQKPFHLKEHLARLRYSAKKTGLDVSYSDHEIEQIVNTLIEKNAPQECGVKFFITGGISADQMFLSEKSTFIVFAYPLTPYPEVHFSQGIKTTTTYNMRSLPCCKTSQYLPAILALKEGKKEGALEALYLNENDEILEATTSNFFAFKNGVLITPKEEGIILGITRSVVLEICKDLFPIEIRSISKEEIPSLDEAFVTASNKEVMPISHINKTPLTVGPLTKTVMKKFKDYTTGLNWQELSIPRYKS